MPEELITERCPAPVHSPAIVSRRGGSPIDLLNMCGHCGNAILRIQLVGKFDGVMWVAVSEYETEKVRTRYA